MAEVTTFPLHKAVEYRNVRKIKILLPWTKDINIKNEKGQTVLLIACEQEKYNDSIMELLLSHEEIDPSAKNEDGFNALHMLAFNGNIIWIEKLFEKFPDMSVDDVTDKGNTPLILAAKTNHLEVIQYLHSKGADINHENKKKYTALLYAANNGYEETTTELLRLGARIDQKDDYCYTPLIKAAGWGFTEVCKILLAHNADVNESNNRGQTALLQAVRANSIETVKILLEHGADPNKIAPFEGKNMTPLISACLKSNVDVMKLLIEYGVDVNFPKPTRVALFVCIKHGFYNGVLTLLNAGVDFKARGPTGGTALGYARNIGHRDIIELLENYQ